MSPRRGGPGEHRAVSLYRHVVEAAFPDGAGTEIVRETVDLFARVRGEVEESRGAAAAWGYTLRASARALWDGAAMRFGDGDGEPGPPAGAGRGASFPALPGRFAPGAALDVRYALRQIRRRPLVALVAVLSLAVGMAANTVLFSAVSGLLLDPLPISEPDRVVRIFGPDARTTLTSSLSRSAVEALNREATALAGVTGSAAFRAGVEVGGRSLLADGEIVVPGFFEVLGVELARGRGFRPEEADAGTGRVAVLSHGLYREWSREAGGEVGATIRVNREVLTVVGVAPEGFGGTNFARPVDLWVPLGAGAVVGAGPGTDGAHAPWLSAIGRVAPGVDVEGASAAVGRVMARLDRERPDRYADEGYFVLGERAGLINPARPELVPAAAAAALGAGLLVLLIVCLNVGGLVLVRAAARREELGVRMALGAGRARLLRQTLVEGGVLVVPAAAAGLWAAAYSDRILTALLPVLRRMSVDFAVDGRLVAFAVGTAVVAALVSAVAPAIFAARQSVSSLVGGRGEVGGGPRRLLNGLAATQVAVAAAVLLLGALFLRTLDWYRDASPGYAVEERVAVTVDVGFHGIAEAEGRVFFDELVRRARDRPAVEEAALARGITTGGPSVRVRAPGETDPLRLRTNAVGPGYFELLRIPVVEGRAFGPEDRREGEPVVVVNETLARRLWGTASPVGRTLPLAEGSEAGPDPRVIGVAGDIRYVSLAEGPRPFAYLPADQRYAERMTLLARGDPDRVVPAVREVVGTLEPGLPVVEATTLEAFVDEDRLLARAAATVGGVLAALALALAALGIYGTMAFSIQRRKPELGIRLAMGAAPSRVFRHVLGRGLGLCGAAGAAGLGAGLGAAALVDDLLVGTSAADPVALVVAPALLGVVVTLALVGPARAAAAVQPVDALREE